jgi:hypothetical protein
MKINKFNESLSNDRKKKLAVELLDYIKDKNKDEISFYVFKFSMENHLTLNEIKELYDEIINVSAEKYMIKDLIDYLDNFYIRLFNKYGSFESRDIYDKEKFWQESEAELDWISQIYREKDELEQIKKYRDSIVEFLK